MRRRGKQRQLNRSAQLRQQRSELGRRPGKPEPVEIDDQEVAAACEGVLQHGVASRVTRFGSYPKE